MIRGLSKTGLALLALLLTATPSLAQQSSFYRTSGSITTGGADCSTSTRCVVLPNATRTSNVTIVVGGTFTGTAQLEGTVSDETLQTESRTWFALNATPAAGGASVSSVTATGQWIASLALTGVRVRASTLSSGTITAAIIATSAGGGGGGAGSNVNVTNGSKVADNARTLAAGFTNEAVVEAFIKKFNGTTYEDERICTTVLPISQTASTKLVSGVSGKKVYICDLVFVAATAEIVNLLSGTGAACVTSPTALIGSTTAANGMSFAANGGLALLRQEGRLRTSVNTDDLCLTQSGTARVSGYLTYIVE